MKRTIKTQVLDRAGTLNRLTSIFVRRQYNIVSLSATPTETEGISNITFIVDVSDESSTETIIKQLEKQVNVLSALDITDTNLFNRELILIKLGQPDNFEEFEQIIKPYKNQMTILKDVDDHIYLQAFGTHQTIENLLNDLNIYPVTQVSRTGSAGLL
ncbi:acetolactate synthase small subunit [Mammaliicoccus stepanovicii]|uniref:Acetolactate synthase small subunit n=1 Tax=Mammaliicoccus stepanovicii TaxID=643214 RepID=A0A239YR39_9STAP|nr:acetolactate synthase small subunit [Mammaliicoccus stepanovicii]PNZ74536.1 acetolactate synthase small subunit [Mammaliicoccus stepanovicii]GGI42489.1 acetolactate synthase small subunit [Mammaliicoccus stepanovicii]SNV60836.1 acetolactate synthase small subunit [Mammaliicoccus stepanovicii]